jgi:Glycosyltransferase family 28 C-terminal domain
VSKKKRKILVAPLDWGLGHATRCIPIIRALSGAGFEVIIGCTGLQKNLLALEFPSLRVVDLPGYEVRYGQGNGPTWLKIISQIPKILTQIKRENRWLEQFLKRETLDGVVSDNRYGLYRAGLPSVFITHQLAIKTNLGRTLDNQLATIHYRYIHKFSCCWVPDYAGPENLAGELAHPGRLPAIPLRYIGPLSRFHPLLGEPTQYDLLVLLSGPEPQRSFWETQLLDQLRHFDGRVILVRGLPGQTRLPFSAGHLEIHNHLPTEALNQVLGRAGLVLSRSGYSTVMDLSILHKKAILVPTPGQPEQQYLARLLCTRHLALEANQRHFDLGASMLAAKSFPFRKLCPTDQPSLQKAVDSWGASLGP